MQFSYTPKGVCSRQILMDIEGGKIKEIAFIGGCSGNTQGVAALCKGKDVQEVIDVLEGIKCGNRPTSCPDQLAKALKLVLEDIEKNHLDA